LLDDLGLGGQDDILEVDDAFKLTTGIEENRFIARWEIAEGHYLYQDKMSIVPSDATIDTLPLQLQPGEEKQDPIFNKLLYVYHDSAEIALPIANSNGVKRLFSRSSTRAARKYPASVIRRKPEKSVYGCPRSPVPLQLQNRRLRRQQLHQDLMMSSPNRTRSPTP
jgi:thiol:disulfide interchange protein